MHFSFKPLLMVSTLVGSFISGSVQASDTLPFSYKDVDDARQNSTTLTYNDNQYTVEECYGDHCQVTSEDFIPSWMMSGYGNTLTILEDMHDPCPNHTNGNYEVGCGPNNQMCHGETIFSATLKLFVPEESDDSPTELSIVPTTVSNDEIETVDEVSSIVVGTQPTPSQVVEVIMENVSMGYNLGNALELILLHPEKNEALELAILAIKRQINLNSKKLNK